MARLEYDNVYVPVVIQTVGGDLRLKGREGDRLIVEGDDPQVEQIAEDQPYVINSGGDCRVTVPTHVTVSVGTVGGDAKVLDLDSRVDIQAVGGDLTVRNVKAIQVKTVGSDLRLKWADGDVSVERVGSDATIREINGGVWVASVGSDLYLRNIEGGCVVENIGSDLVLSIDFQADMQYRFSAGSDILCRIQPDTNARFVLPAGTNIRVDVPAEVEVNEDEDTQTITLGEGGPTVHINAADSLRLVGEGEEYMINLGVQIEEELETRLSSLEEQLSKHLEGLDERIQVKALQFASQAEKFAERAQRQAERTAERVRRSLERQQSKNKRRAAGTRASVSRPVQPVEPVTEQERLMILQMVQENKISIEEAERLLSALDESQSQSQQRKQK